MFKKKRRRCSEKTRAHLGMERAEKNVFATPNLLRSMSCPPIQPIFGGRVYSNSLRRTRDAARPALRCHAWYAWPLAPLPWSTPVRHYRSPAELLISSSQRHWCSKTARTYFERRERRTLLTQTSRPMPNKAYVDGSGTTSKLSMNMSPLIAVCRKE